MRISAIDHPVGWLGYLAGFIALSFGAAQTVPGSVLPVQRKTFRPAFTATSEGEYQFDSGVLRGNLRAEGKSFGLSSLVHVASGVTLSRGYGIFSHYRVFVTNARFGTAAWDWPSTARLLDDGAVEVRWPAEEGRPFEMTATYRWREPSSLDLETVVKAQKDLPNFEAFLASYFDPAFTNSLVFVRENPEAGGKPGFLSAKKTFGDWQMFPRDAEAASLIKDGRWKIEPHPVDWVIMPEFGKPLAMRRDPKSGIAAALMSPPEDCFAISTPYETEGHYSVYLSLFGRTIRAGEMARARTRFWIAQNPSDEQVLNKYQAYLNELRRRASPATTAR